MGSQDWSDAENDAIVADYLTMLSEELAGRAYSKAARNRDLQGAIGRSRAAIEFKHRNISAVLQEFGQPVILGYRPASHAQEALFQAVWRGLASFRPPPPPPAVGLAEGREIYVSPPPTLRNTPPPSDLGQMSAIAARFDVAGRDARNRALGRAGEELVLRRERATLVTAGRSDLARAVRWVSDEDGDGAGYDIASYAPDGAPRLIEVKTTNGWERTPFHISPNELAVAAARRDSWRLFRLWNFARAPSAFELRPPLEAHVALTPTSFRADFR